jgi:hypothetical protein
MKVSSPSMLGLLTCSGVGFVAAEEDGSIGNNSTYVYVAYFSDSSCSQFAGIKPIFPDDSPTEFTMARKDGDGNDIPCYDAMACVYSPDGPTCKSFVGEDPEIVSVNYTSDKDGNVFECDPSNLDVGQPECATLDYSACVESSIYNCHWHFFTQDMLKTSLLAQQHQGTVDEVPAGAASSCLSASFVGSVLGVVLVFGLL